MKLSRSVLGAALAVLLLAGCAVVIGGRAERGQGADRTDYAESAPPRARTPISWQDCFDPSADVNVPEGTACGVLSVPVDYARPDGDAAGIFVIRFPATGEKIGSLIINPGGPGESGANAALAMVGTLPQAIRERFDLVGFDPRGVGNSAPAAVCNSDEDNDRLRALDQVDYSEAGVASIEAETKQFVQRCVDEMGDEFLANLGTENVAKDLDALRQELGDDKLTYLGYSYGTRIGASYAEQFPDKVRAMILDGGIDPNADPAEADIRQAAAFQKAFDNYAADCAKTPSCPLGTDPAKAVDVYHSLVNPLVGNPAETEDPRGLSYSDAIIGTILPLYSPTLWSRLTQGLTELTENRGDTLLSLSDEYMKRDADGHYSNSTDVRVAVNCVDKPPITDRAKVVDQDRKAREVAPFMSYGEFTGHAPLSTCAFWPVPPTSEPHELKVEGLPPTLIVSTTNDPATPYQAGVELAEQLGGTLLTFEGTQHTVVFQGDACVDDIAVKYLVDVTVPPAGTRC